jgi:hypothetical protein
MVFPISPPPVRKWAIPSKAVLEDSVNSPSFWLRGEVILAKPESHFAGETNAGHQYELIFGCWLRLRV